VIIRLVSSTCRFATQMLILLLLCGEDSTWLFDGIQLLSKTFLFWAMLLLLGALAHFWYIEYPYALAMLESNDCSDLTCATFGSSSSVTDSLLNQEDSYDSPPRSPPPPPPAANEEESLLTVSRAEAPLSPIGSSQYSSVSLTSPPTTPTDQTTGSDSLIHPPAALQHLYEVSIQDEFFLLLSYFEMVLLGGVLLVLCQSLPNISRH